MNYRHAFHAGNFADVMKHVVLTRIITHLLRKPAPFRVIDTHAGIGLYDLTSDEATRTGEWRGGVARMGEAFAPEVETLLAPWRAVLAGIRARRGEAAYPGSPSLAREMLRPDDRAIFVEKHPEDRALLARRFSRAANVKVVELDGWLALGGFIPPPERRGLVLIDPPFEEPGEFARCGAQLRGAVRRWPTGVFALWYPVKHPGEVEGLARTLRSHLAAPTLRLELNLASATGARLVGSGMMIVNPPWTLEAEAATLLPALARRFDAVAPWICEMLVGEPT